MSGNCSFTIQFPPPLHFLANPVNPEHPDACTDKRRGVLAKDMQG